MLHQFISSNRQDIIDRCRAKVATRSFPPPTKAEVDHGVPLFLDQLVQVLRLRQMNNPEISQGALERGHDMLLQGFTVSHVVHDYGDVCQAITELALERDAPISTDDFRLLNGCLDDAIASAVTAYGYERNKADVDDETARANERLGFLAHELRNLLNTAMLAFEALKTGRVGISGSTGAVLQRTLKGLGTLIGRSLAEVRLRHGIQHPERFDMSSFIEELAPGAALEASARGLNFSVTDLEESVTIEADRQVLASVVGNLLQNAFKFTRPGTRVLLRVCAGADRVMIEVQDECGGLPSGDAVGLFQPFEQRSADRSGLGLGLAFSRWAIEAQHGRLTVRNLRGRGCVFTIDMPRIPVAVGARRG